MFAMLKQYKDSSKSIKLIPNNLHLLCYFSGLKYKFVIPCLVHLTQSFDSLTDATSPKIISVPCILLCTIILDPCHKRLK